MSKKLYVGNLPYSISDEELAELFSPIGAVASAKVIKDRNSGRSKGFGFVEMSDDKQAAEAIAKLNGSDMSGRPLTVNEAKPQENNFGAGKRR